MFCVRFISTAQKIAKRSRHKEVAPQLFEAGEKLASVRLALTTTTRNGTSRNRIHREQTEPENRKPPTEPPAVQIRRTRSTTRANIDKNIAYLRLEGRLNCHLVLDVGGDHPAVLRTNLRNEPKHTSRDRAVSTRGG